MATWEVLKSPSQARAVRRLKSARALDKFAALDGCTITDSYQGESDWLVVWGASAQVQRDAFNAHRAKGRNVMCLDMGYYSTELGAVRMSINAPHPQELAKAITEPRPGFVVPALDDFYNPDGHILVAGMGTKSRQGLGMEGWNWERDQVRKLSNAYPGRRIMYRPKPRQRETIEGTIDASEGQIGQYLRGCSLVVVHHSNIVVDCALHGLPCVAYGGIGIIGYNSSIENPAPRLLGGARDGFLNRVAWFNWLPTEFEAMRAFAIQLTNEGVK